MRHWVTELWKGRLLLKLWRCWLIWALLTIQALHVILETLKLLHVSHSAVCHCIRLSQINLIWHHFHFWFSVDPKVHVSMRQPKLNCLHVLHPQTQRLLILVLCIIVITPWILPLWTLIVWVMPPVHHQTPMLILIITSQVMSIWHSSLGNGWAIVIWLKFMVKDSSILKPDFPPLPEKSHIFFENSQVLRHCKMCWRVVSSFWHSN